MEGPIGIVRAVASEMTKALASEMQAFRGGADPYFLTPKDGTARKTRTGSELSGVVEVPRVPQAVLSPDRNDLPRDQDPDPSVVHGRVRDGQLEERCGGERVERRYNLTAKTAWFMVHRIREAMRREPMAGLLTGQVVVEEPTSAGSRRTGTATSRRAYRA
jgi:hypothetical protein